MRTHTHDVTHVIVFWKEVPCHRTIGSGSVPRQLSVCPHIFRHCKSSRDLLTVVVHTIDRSYMGRTNERRLDWTINIVVLERVHPQENRKKNKNKSRMIGEEDRQTETTQHNTTNSHVTTIHNDRHRQKDAFHQQTRHGTAQRQSRVFKQPLNILQRIQPITKTSSNIQLSSNSCHVID